MVVGGGGGGGGGGGSLPLTSFSSGTKLALNIMFSLFGETSTIRG